MFAIGLIIYSAIDRRDKWFMLTEIGLSILFIGIGKIVLTIPNDIIRSLLLGFLFIIIGLVPRMVIPHPKSHTDTDGQKKEIRIGIINWSWICIMGCTLAFIGFAVGASPFIDPIPVKGLNPDYCQKSLDIVTFLLGKTIDSISILGAIIAGCMTILWSGEIWRKSDEKSITHYKLTTRSAIKMVIAYFIVIGNIIIWIGSPLYNRMIMLVDVLK
jgi:hypothetical protein